MNYIGIDNGVTGSLALISEDRNRVSFIGVPVMKEQSYTKKKAQITRIDWKALQTIFASWMYDGHPSRAFIERPYVNPQGFKASVSALRALEATLICIEFSGISYQYVDSKEWQKEMLPKGCKGAELKSASLNLGCRLFPEYAEDIRRHKDADALLIAEWSRRRGL